jgi:hypothetical protein
MMLVLELITTFLLGFLLGRVWEIRQRLVLAEHRHRRQRRHSVGRRVVNRGAERSQTTDSNPSVPSDRHNKELSAASASALPFRSGPAAFAGRLRASHQQQ